MTSTSQGGVVSVSLNHVWQATQEADVSETLRFQACDECEHFRYDHLNDAGYCQYGPFACDCAEFEEPRSASVGNQPQEQQ